MYFLFAQGIPIAFTIFIVLMDSIKPKDAPLPNVGEFSCFVGSEFATGKSFFQTSQFFYYYLIILAIITFNIVCFVVTAINLSRHWQAMKDIQTTRWGMRITELRNNPNPSPRTGIPLKPGLPASNRSCRWWRTCWQERKKKQCPVLSWLQTTDCCN